MPNSIHNSLSPADSPPAAAGARASPPAHLTRSSARGSQGAAARSSSQSAHAWRTPSACSRIGSHVLDPCRPCITCGGIRASGMRCCGAKKNDYGAFLQVPPHAAGSADFKAAGRLVSQHQSVPPAGGEPAGLVLQDACYSTPPHCLALALTPSPVSVPSSSGLQWPPIPFLSSAPDDSSYHCCAHQ